MVVKIKAGIDAEGNVLDWNHDVWSTSHATRPEGKAGNLISSHYLEQAFTQPTPKEIGAPTYGPPGMRFPLTIFPAKEW